MSPLRRAWLGIAALGAWVWAAGLVWAIVATHSEYHVATELVPLSIVLIVLGLWSARRLPRKLWALARVLPRARRNRTDLLRHLVYRPAILGAVAAYESAVLLGSQADARLKALAELKASSLVGCPF